MKCPSCLFENSADAKFCRNCGTKFTPEASAGAEQQNNINAINGNRVNQNKGFQAGNVMTTGCKVWFWLVILGNISLVGNNLELMFRLWEYAFMSSAFKLALVGILSGLVSVAGAAIILFRQRKFGLYMIIAMSVIVCVVNIMCHVNIIFALVSAVLNPLISYYFVNKNSVIIK